MRLLILLLFLSLSFAAFAGGPTGYGALKLGLSKQAVEALSTSDGVYASSPLTAYNYKNSSPRPGEDKFDVLLTTPLSNSPIKSVLTFKEDKLVSIFLKFDPNSNMFEQVKAQITQKYGEGKVTDGKKEEQCLYKNGANFKITSGKLSINWFENGSEKVKTQLSDIVLDSCPANLRYSSVGAIKLKTLTIEVSNDNPDSSTQNLF